MHLSLMYMLFRLIFTNTTSHIMHSHISSEDDKQSGLVVIFIVFFSWPGLSNAVLDHHIVGVELLHIRQSPNTHN